MTKMTISSVHFDDAGNDEGPRSSAGRRDLRGWGLRPLAALATLATLPFAWSTCDGKTYTGLELVERSPHDAVMLLIGLGVAALLGYVATRVVQPQARLSVHLLGAFAAGVSLAGLRQLMLGDVLTAGYVALALGVVVLVEASARAALAARVIGLDRRALEVVWPLVAAVGFSGASLTALLIVDRAASGGQGSAFQLASGLVTMGMLLAPWAAASAFAAVAWWSASRDEGAGTTWIAAAGLTSSVLWPIAIGGVDPAALGIAAVTLLGGLGTSYLARRRAPVGSTR